MISPAAIIAAIDAQLGTVSFPAANIAYTNVTYAPVSGVPYLRAEMASMTRTPQTLGRDRTFDGSGYLARWDGVYMVTVVWPENAGGKGCAEMQAQLLSLFPRGITLETSDGASVIFEAPTPMPMRPDNAWLRGGVRCPWFLFEVS